MSDIGITGTREGATPQQLISLTAIFGLLSETADDIIRLHHGDCIGVDQQACELAVEAGFLLVCHPPDNPRLQANISSDHYWVKKPYLKRNRDIVNHSNVLIALPKGDTEDLWSGTWSTIRYAKRVEQPFIIIFPDGTIIWNKTSYFIQKEGSDEEV